MRNYLEEFIRELKNRNYSKNTVRIYSGHLRHFLEFSRRTQYEPGQRISLFLEKEHKSAEQRRLAWSSVKLFYELILNKPCPYKLDRVKSRKRLPDILSRDEVLDILDHIINSKHKLLISLLYGSGLRVSEVCSLKIRDVNFNDLSLKIRNSKGHKDRVTLLSEKFIDPLKELIQGRGGSEYIFLSLNRKKYSVRTVQKIFTNALNKSSIQKSPTCHTLRHCFATHLVEAGVDIKTVKTLLGHKSVKTTMIYINLADPISKKIKSPL